MGEGRRPTVIIVKTSERFPTKSLKLIKFNETESTKGMKKANNTQNQISQIHLIRERDFLSSSEKGKMK